MPVPKIVLCSIDLTDLAEREVALASQLCEAFGARLVLHHNVIAVSPGITRAWEWKEAHAEARESGRDVEQRLRRIMDGLPKTFPAEATITSGSLVPILVELATRLPADVVVLGSHGWSTEEHASAAERFLDRAPCPVLTVHESAVTPPRARLRARPGEAMPEATVLVDRTDAGMRVLDEAFDLARSLGFYLHVLHVGGDPVGSPAYEQTRARLASVVPDDLTGRVQCRVEAGDPVERIVDFLSEHRPDLAVMGEHARGFLRRYLTRDTAREILHRAPCPVWFVPPR